MNTIKDFFLAFQQENIPALSLLCQNTANVTTYNYQINTFFNKAFKNGKVNIVKWCLTHEPSLNLKLEEKILFSQLENNFKIVKLFLELNPTYDNSKLLEQAMSLGNIEMSDYLFQKNNSILQNNETMLEILTKHCNKNNINMINYLLEKDNNLIKKNMHLIKKYISNHNIIKEFLKYYPDMFKDYITEEENNYMIKRQNAIEEGYMEDNDQTRDMHYDNLFISQCCYGHFNNVKLIYDCYPDVIKFNWAFVLTCESGLMEIAKWLYEKRPDYPIHIWEFAFMWSCMHGKLDIVKWIYSVKPDININADCGNNDDDGFENSDVNGFTMACTNGALEVAKWLLEIDPIKTLSGIDEFDTFALVCKERKYQNDIEGNSYDPLPILKWLLEIKPDINISKNNEMAFYYACVYNNKETANWLLQIKPDLNISIDNNYIFRKSASNLEIIKWLLEIKPDIDIEMNNHEVFKNACENHGYEAVKFLVSLNPTKYIVKFTDWGSIESWKIYINYIRKQTVEIKLSDIQGCPICMDKNSQVITNCKHSFCVKCIKKICESENKCPYCRAIITDMFPFRIIKE
jgi:hypothetical protein